MNAVLRDAASRDLHLAPGLVGFPMHWQVPAATEQAAWEAQLAAGPAAGFDYLGFPWATLIDGLRRNAPSLGPVLVGLGDVRDALAAGHRRRLATVAQHIHAGQFIDLFRAAGITDLFWSHAVHGQETIAGIRVHPFPIYPAQAPQPRTLPPGRPRRWLANFIGAYSPGLYLTDVRQRIFELGERQHDLLVVRRHEWHFDRAVYEEQMTGRAPGEAQLAEERRRAAEYLRAMHDSWFTLCPTGSGPNSIRIYESLALGTIPIVLSTRLRLAGPDPLWRAAALVEEDSEAGLWRALEAARSLSEPRRIAMVEAGRALAAAVLPGGYAGLLAAAMREVA